MQTLTDLESGLVWIVIATTAGQVGLDMTVCNVIILDLPSDFEAITQWNGHASWDGQGGCAGIYAANAIHIENVADLDSDPVTGKRKMSEKALTGWKEYWEKCAPAIVKYYNPGLMRYCHDVMCAYYGGLCEKPVHCCEAPGCHPGPPVDLYKTTYEYASKLANGH